MKKLLVSAIILFVYYIGFAADFYENGFAYSVISDLENLCAIEANEESPYNGAIVIPSVAHNNGKDYQVYQISENAFSQCDGVTSLTIPATLKAIKDDCFAGCTSLSKIIIEDSDNPLSFGRTTTGSSGSSKGLFRDAALNEIYIGRNLSYYYNGNSGYYGPFDGGFAENEYIKVSFGELVTEVAPYVCAYSSGISELKLGSNIKSIGASAFNQALNITSLILPEAIETIGTNAFYGNLSIHDVVFGVNIKTISAYAFSSCSGLASVYCYATTPPAATNAAYSYHVANARLRVPAESVKLYKSNSMWKEFGEILPFGGTEHFYPSKYNLSIIFPENGKISQTVAEGSTVIFNVKPFSGWQIHSINLNGDDLTTKLSDNGDIEIGPINADSELNVVFSSSSSAINTVNDELSPTVSVNNHTVTIKGEYNSMELYNTAGQLINRGKNSSFDIETAGIYILKIDGQSYKFLIN